MHTIEKPARYDDRPIYPAKFKAQAAALADDQTVREAEILAAKRHESYLCPAYHYVASHGYMNDPNGFCRWRGRWHLFYQEITAGTIYWGHAVSDDLAHWEELPYAVYPGDEDQSWSGGVTIDRDADGNDVRAAAMYYGHGGKTGLYCAVSSDDLLLNFTKVGSGPVIPSIPDFETIRSTVPYVSAPTVYDPCIWRDGGYYYALSGGIRQPRGGGAFVREEYLYRSADLENWEYLHPFLEDDSYSEMFDDGACPYFVPLNGGNKGGTDDVEQRYLLMSFSHRYGAQYFLGNYDRSEQKFHVTGGDKLAQCSMEGGYMAPSAFAEEDGTVRAIYIMHTPDGYSCMSLPHTLSLPDAMPDMACERLYALPSQELELLRERHTHTDGFTLSRGREYVIDGAAGNQVELIVTMRCPTEASAVIKLLRSADGEQYTAFTLYPERGPRFKDPEWRRDSILAVDCSRSQYGGMIPTPETVRFSAPSGGIFKLHIFVDHSVVEVFTERGMPLGKRVRPDTGSETFSITALGADIELLSVDRWELHGANEKSVTQHK